MGDKDKKTRKMSNMRWEKLLVASWLMKNKSQLAIIMDGKQLYGVVELCMDRDVSLL